MVLHLHALTAIALLAAPARAGDVMQIEKTFGSGRQAQYAGGKVFRAGDVVTVNDLQVALGIEFVQLGFPLIATAGGTRRADEELTVVGYSVSNRSRTRKVAYRRPDGFPGSAASSLSDEHGNAYKPIRFGPGEDLVGREPAQAVSIAPRESSIDMVAFEAPVAAAKTLRFSLPLAMFAPGDKRRITFRIEVGGLRSTLHQRRAAFLAAVDTGIPSLTWRMSQDAARIVFPRIKHDDPPAWAAAAPIDCWYDVTATVAGRTANVELCFYANELYEVRMNLEGLSLQDWTRIVSASPLGPPTSMHPDRATWEVGPTQMIAFEPAGDHLLVNADYAPLKMREPPHQ